MRISPKSQSEKGTGEGWEIVSTAERSRLGKGSPDGL